MPREVAIGEAEAGDGAAEAHLAGAVDVEARLERNATERRAVAITAGAQRAGRKHHIAAWPGAARLDVARHRTVSVDAAVTGRAVEARVREVLACDEAARLVGSHFLGLGRDRMKRNAH